MRASRVQECQATGRSGQTRVTARAARQPPRDRRSLPGDPPLEATVGREWRGDAAALRHRSGAGTGQIFEGANNARRFTGSHPGRGRCQMVYDLRRVSTRIR
jgi:hypothetical protein